jgi:hypothetical protein
MTRRMVLMMAAALVSVLAIPVGVAAGAHLSGVTGTGITTCANQWSGKLTFNPRLKNAGMATMETVRIKAVAKPCAGGTPTPPLAKVIGEGVITGAGANSCGTIFAGGGVFAFSPSFIENLDWAGGINSSTAAFPNVTESNITDPPYVSFSFSPGVVTGSFPTGGASQSIKTIRTLANIMGNGNNKCGGMGLGVGSLTIRAAGTFGIF